MKKTVCMRIEDEYSSREYQMGFNTWVEFALTAIKLIEDSKKIG